MRSKDRETQPALGLREKRKRSVRSELSLAALRLAREHGLDNVRTEDIAAAAGVSRRTFNNYFANKYEAIADRLVERAQWAAESLPTRPRSETLWQALSAVLLAPYEGLASAFGNAPAAARKRTLLLLEDPSLRAEIFKGDLAAQQALTGAIAERTGTDPGDLYPALVAATAIAALTTALNRWLRSTASQPLVPLIRDSLSQIEQGLPEPARRKR